MDSAAAIEDSKKLEASLYLELARGSTPTPEWASKLLGMT